ncbi:hypothetical protein CDD80_2455 [Ophiocordyceps camponoti-rufipedis]|uniref:U2 small nuclear ribonucleoprotein A' n=1 Tax=Ophiocordyceps camponoti-rufipedis TaxID=2004952 RepID=A0A2C5YBA5_9HYPO|nr:hypothetical protein CDD80_2455 [Ophiocordyceps camponoti-rufipedis]
MRLTADLIQNSLSYLNPLKERELDLRGQRIPTIENLAAAGPHDCIDFTDNDIQVLGNFPLSPRITTLLMARNRISSIQPNLSRSLPNLANLVLSNNNLTELADLEALSGFSQLTHLALLDNPVVKREIMARKTTSFELSTNGSSGASKLSRMMLTEEEKRRLRERINQATSFKEIEALEKELNEGRVPSGVQDAMEK